ncbi:MAG: PspC domain-containing protein, partial [Acidimicrobiales bacterium]
VLAGAGEGPAGPCQFRERSGFFPIPRESPSLQDVAMTTTHDPARIPEEPGSAGSGPGTSSSQVGSGPGTSSSQVGSGPGTPPDFVLVRPVEGRMVAGVAAGIARHFDLDLTLVRLVIVLAALAGGLGIPAYLAAWLLVPDEGTGISIASDLLNQAHRLEAF